MKTIDLLIPLLLSGTAIAQSPGYVYASRQHDLASCVPHGDIAYQRQSARHRWLHSHFGGRHMTSRAYTAAELYDPAGRQQRLSLDR